MGFPVLFLILIVHDRFLDSLSPNMLSDVTAADIITLPGKLAGKSKSAS